jgi:DNA mismatch endonuclease (patch repair protein)
MSRIRGKGTAIEESLRKALWREGIRYRKNPKDIPGKPDIAIRKPKIAIFCDGEFWHGKGFDTKITKIQNNREFWLKKISRNIARDIETNKKLHGLGWMVLRFWESDIRKDLLGCLREVRDLIASAPLGQGPGRRQQKSAKARPAAQSLRKALWKDGIRYRRDYRMLPGAPDIAITKHRVAIFCEGPDTGPDMGLRIGPKHPQGQDLARILRSLDWKVLSFQHAEIQNDLPACLNEVKEAILEQQADG